MRLPRLALAASTISALLLSITLASSVAAGGRPLVASLTPGAETGGGDPSSAATGSFWATFNRGQGEVCYELSWSNLSTNVAAAHIHVAPAGVNGPVVIPLSTTPTTSGSTSGCVTPNPDLIKAIIQNPSGYYVNVHTTGVPAGAVRGQLEPPED